MSKELAVIKGRFEEVTNAEKRESRHSESTLSLTSFFGGEANGKMLQMTIQQSDGNIAFVQLTREQVKELIATSVEFLF